MNDESINPGPLLEISGYYWKTCTLHAAVKLDIFTAIGDDLLDASTIGKTLGADPDATERLLNALTAMDLLTKSDGRYGNTRMTRKFLVKTSFAYVGNIIKHHHYLVDSWSRLDKAVMTGKPVRTSAARGDADRLESFLMGMFNLAMGIAPGLVKQIDLSGRKRLLDMGGGPGTYAIHFCMENTQLHGTVFDLAATRPFAEKTIKKFGMQDRVEFSDGNYLEDEIPGHYDVAWMSHILHAEGPEDCRRMIQKAVTVLESGGLIMIHEFILDNDEDSPLFPALFSLNMLCGTETGRAYSEQQIAQMLLDAGVVDIRRHAFRGPNDSGVMIGVKK